MGGIKLDSRFKDKDSGFMGYTHAMSALAIGTLLILLYPKMTAIHGLIGYESHLPLAVVIPFIFVITGAVGFNDLDSVSSRVKNDLGALGGGLSTFFRWSSTVIQSTIRTKRDPKPGEVDPHRGFWHTIEGALLVSLTVFLLTSIPIKIPFDLSFKISSFASVNIVSFGDLFSIFIMYLCVHLTFSNLGKNLFSKWRKALRGKVLSTGFSVLVTIVIFVTGDIELMWLGFLLGMFIHSAFGDAWTTSGAPVSMLYGFLVHGKVWWKIRMTSMKTGGAVENYVVLPLFTLSSIINIALIAYGTGLSAKIFQALGMPIGLSI